VEAWAAWAPRERAPRWHRTLCEERWRRGVPLLAESSPEITADDVEAPFAAAMEAVTAARPDETDAMRRLAEEWDAGRLGPASFLATRGAVAEDAARRVSMRPAVAAFLACAGLRPALEWSLHEARGLLADGVWALGVCPFCGAPPGFGDIIEDGRRRLVCHLCGGTWIFSRVRCALCGVDAPRDLLRLEPGGSDEAYFISACTRCKGYVKEVDRRQRWNARSALVEDWGSPHLDLVARRDGYWRPIPTLLEVAAPN
jgi:FdhE protein